MGSFAQQVYNRDEEAQQAILKSKVAPLSQSLQADQVRLAAFTDPKTGHALPDHEEDYERIMHNMQSTIGDMRGLLGDKAPKAGVLDRLHIRRDLQNRVKTYQDETNRQAAGYANASLPYEMTPAGQAEAAKAKAALELQGKKNEGVANRGNATRPVPYVRGAVNRSQASEAAQLGKVYMDQDGNQIDVSKIPDGMFLLPIFGGGGKEWYELTTDPGRYETGDNQRKFEPSIGGPNPNAPSIGAARVPTERSSSSTDSLGVTTSTHSTSTPVTPGSTANPAPRVEGPKTQSLRKVQGGQSNAGPAPKATPKAAGKKLDENGNIPSNAGNPNLVAAANELLHGKAQKDLKVPTKDLAAVDALARQYGYLGEGMWTPRESMQVNQSQQLLDSLRKDKDFLSVYDEGPLKRAAIATAIEKAKTSGIKANLERTLINMGLDEKDIKFIQSYQNLVGRIQGLALLTRGSGRPTEAAVNRMMQELPNVLTAQSKDEAQHAFDLIQNEIDIGMGGNKTGPKTKQLKQTKDLSDRLSDALEGK